MTSQNRVILEVSMATVLVFIACLALFAHLKRGASGHLLYETDGHLVDECSAVPPPPSDCVDSPVPCAECDDITPLYYLVTFSGMAACADCFTFGGTDAKVTFLIDPNAAFTVTQQSAPDECSWLFQSTVPYVRVSVYATDDGTCGGDPVVEIDEDIVVLLERTATDWRLRLFTNSGQLFCDTKTALVDGATQLCASLPGFENDITTCGTATCPIVFGDFDQATGGTATVVCTSVPAPCDCVNDDHADQFAMVNPSVFAEDVCDCRETLNAWPEWDGIFDQNLGSCQRGVEVAAQLYPGTTVPIDGVGNLPLLRLDTDNCRFIVDFWCDEPDGLTAKLLWQGEKTTGVSFNGTYTKIAGCSSVATIEIEAA